MKIFMMNMMTKPHPQASILGQSQYDDVIDERNIVGLCGYPLCQQKLGPVPTQRYRIIVERKEILDITERKVRGQLDFFV